MLNCSSSGQMSQADASLPPPLSSSSPLLQEFCKNNLKSSSQKLVCYRMPLTIRGIKFGEGFSCTAQSLWRCLSLAVCQGCKTAKQLKRMSGLLSTDTKPPETCYC
ncbi:hypothetical protein GOODEAATRI_020543 [Goodea atripinnis]|uniref:Uncharacterized protein n=1 Tax=Goodea atripinnis TaxID=208336 RepID=A0ABV0PZN5_9TELE